ncbi:MAG TPA: anthranilate synthase component I [Mycobacteriales bacterium]|nr:anthranilate synthase component I [Mycobacteriales bacterium]
MSHVEDRWVTTGGVSVVRTRTPVDPGTVRAELAEALDTRRGLLLSCAVRQPGRYRPRDVGYVDPPVEIVASGRTLTARALNIRGRVLLPAVAAAWTGVLSGLSTLDNEVTGEVPPAPERPLSEEERTRRPGVFTALRALVAHFAGPADDTFGLWGAFGYDLILGFDPVPLTHDRTGADRDLVLHLPDSVVLVDPDAGVAYRNDYELTVDGRGTAGLPRDTPPAPMGPAREPETRRDHPEGGYAELVRTAQAGFAVGDMFEVVPSQCFARPADTRPAEMFDRLRRRNPAPYGLLANLGGGEFLVGASPEMFVRVGHPVDGRRRVETSPISGTVARGRDALEDERAIRWLLGSGKEESELTMCTDVDRNDKARVCEPGSVRVIGRRQIELYSTLIHTVDHVEGTLRPDRDALDAFLTHVWAVTVTGAPKRAAVQFIEQHERSKRRWYGGAVGRVGFDGAMDTALTLRTIQVRDGVATVRAGATLLHDSDPAAEEQETVLKALALLDAVELPDVALPAVQVRPGVPAALPGMRVVEPPGAGRSVLLADHEDSFVHTLADYFRQTGASVTTLRHGFAESVLDELDPDLLVLSPGPRRPADFGISALLTAAGRRGLPVFGICLGLQGLAEHVGGTLGVLPVPAHGRASKVELVGDGGLLLAGLPPVIEVGRYHSLHAVESSLPPELVVTARTGDGVVMAVEHRTEPLAAVQFHPESIMSLHDRHGHTVVTNAVTMLARRGERAAV